ncbi:uncharacterized protein LOC125093451 [Lutra lutra]|uniref:uncharacterized protein LOC125093451 n=1 Tax=Lutra lutra TaxID=9657 RepID=UPI001FD5AD0F|nr:uncharacterized protein LOC125093451 [Lutra lutra]XP_047574548.1 uncharacterized protein LOC125093451 [Lutra lutra]
MQIKVKTTDASLYAPRVGFCSPAFLGLCSPCSRVGILLGAAGGHPQSLTDGSPAYPLVSTLWTQLKETMHFYYGPANSGSSPEALAVGNVQKNHGLSVSGWNMGQSCDLETDYCHGSVLKIDRRLPSARTPLACALRLFLPACSQLSLPRMVISGGGPHVSRCPGQRLRLTSGEFLSTVFLSLSPGLLVLMLAWMHLSVPSARLCLPTVGTDESVHSPPTAVATFLSSPHSSAQGGQRGSSSGPVSKVCFLPSISGPHRVHLLAAVPMHFALWALTATQLSHVGPHPTYTRSSQGTRSPCLCGLDVLPGIQD